MTTIPQHILDALEEWNEYILIGHREPDGDCTSSGLALSWFLERRGKRCHLVSPGPFQRPELDTLSPYFASHVPKDIDQDNTAVIILDCSTLERIDYLADEIEGLPVIVIDHHSSGNSFGDHRFIDDTAPAVTFMILHIIEAAGFTPTEDEAQTLLFGLATDTGFFRHLGAHTPETFEAVARLTAAGANPNQIHRQMYGGRPLASKQLLGLLIHRARAYADGRVMITYETLEEQQQFGIENRDSDSLYQQLQSIEGCEAVALIREEKPGECSIGLRSNFYVDVGIIALELGGGGHARAAGLSWQGSRQSAEEHIRTALEAAVHAVPNK
ncbi:MAG TPA: bifunctional oligoribonuclease/PAP phosphatase NrnA [Clostridia bacterium]|nr:bifunctional oligoribonuclease/PAP phosphatase NrnA [Clostridia bacterium]